MKIFKVGDRAKGFCVKCDSIVTTYFFIRTVPLSNGKGSVSDILVAVCESCDHVVSIPQQSAPRIKEVLKTKKNSIEVRLPRHLLDILLLASDKFDLGNPELLKDVLIRYYILVAETDSKIVENIKKYSNSEFAKGSDYRLSLKVNDSISFHLDQLLKKTSLNKTQILKGIILLINEDILQKPIQKRIDELHRFLVAVA